MAASHVAPTSPSLILGFVKAYEYDEWRLFVRDDSVSVNRVAKTNEQLSLH
jgi:hypothetical protein